MRAASAVACLRVLGALAVIGVGCYDPDFISGVTECSPDGDCPYDWTCHSGVCVDPSAPTGAAGMGGSGTGAGTGGMGGSAGTANPTGAGTGGMGGAAPPTGSAGAGGTGTGAAWAADGSNFVTVPADAGAGWHGYAFATADASSTGTLDAGDCGPSCLLTMTGTVGPANAANNFAGYLSVGFKIAMATGSEQVETAAPTGTALRVTFSNGSVAPDLRLVLYDGATSWCATASGPSPITVPYTSFHTSCWDGAGTAYARQPLQVIQLIIPGADTPTAVNLTLGSVSEN